MTVAETRAELAATLDAALPVKVRAYKPAQTMRPGEGWIEINQLDTEACTFGEVRLTFALVIPVSSARPEYEKKHDELAAPVVAAVKDAGGRAPVVTSTQYEVGQATLYTLVTTFVIESETEES